MPASNRRRTVRTRSKGKAAAVSAPGPVYITRQVHFNAAHRLHNPAKSQAWNEKQYGLCTNPHWHGHNYVLEVTLKGRPDPVTGYIMDLGELKRVLHRAVVDKYCVTCHNEKVKTAGLMLDQADLEKIPQNAEVWEKVARKLRTGAMPPAGLPRPMLYAPQDREVMAILGARRYAMQGMRPGDKVLAALSLGLSNGGFALRDTIWKYIGAIPIMTGGGNTTPTRRQVEIMKAWGVDIICSFPAYLRHLAITARDEMKIDPHSLGVRALHSHIGIEDRTKIEALWNAPVYDMYVEMPIFESTLRRPFAVPLTARFCASGTGTGAMQSGGPTAIVSAFTTSARSSGDR